METSGTYKIKYKKEGNKVYCIGMIKKLERELQSTNKIVDYFKNLQLYQNLRKKTSVLISKARRK